MLLTLLAPFFLLLTEQQLGSILFLNGLLELAIQLLNLLQGLIALLGSVDHNRAVKSRKLVAPNRSARDIDSRPTQHVKQLANCPHRTIRINVISAVSSIVTEATQHIHLGMDLRVHTILERAVIQLVVKVPAVSSPQTVDLNDVVHKAFEDKACLNACHARITDRSLFSITAMNQQLRPYTTDETKVCWLRRQHQYSFLER